jgi:hypothetical protein
MSLMTAAPFFFSRGDSIRPVAGVVTAFAFGPARRIRWRQRSRRRQVSNVGLYPLQ